MSLIFSDLPYDYEALEPYIDARTMEIHYDRHHRTYFNNLTGAIKDTPTADFSIEQILGEVSKHVPAVRNNAGGYFNHNLYWRCMKSDGSEPTAEFAEAVNRTFGSLDELKAQMTQAGLTRFGSGFAWLIAQREGANLSLTVASTPNQDNPLMDVSEVRGEPILALDVWEHAYYLKYQNKRPDYIDAWWHVVDWEQVSQRFVAARQASQA